MEYFDFMLEPFALSLIIGSTTILVLYWYAARNHSYWKNIGIPYVKPYPFLGTFYEIMTNPFQEVELQRYKQYGKIYGNYEGSDILLSVGETALVKDILVKDFQFFTDKRKIPVSDKIISKMLNVVRGEDWKRIRAIVTPTFTTGKIKRTLSIFKDSASTAVKNLKVYAEKGEHVELKRIYGCYTMDVIASSAFSTKIDSHNNPNNELVKQAEAFFQTNATWRVAGYFLFPSVWNFFKVCPAEPSVLEFFCDITNRITEERKRTGQTRNDFLQLLLDTAREMEENGNVGNEKDIAENYGKDHAVDYILKNNRSTKHLTLNELVAQCLVFFVAGYETTASTLSFVTYLLALNQDAQDKVRAEVDQAIKDNNGEMTYEVIQSMKYLDNVISESLRLYPPLPRIERAAEADYSLGDTGLNIKKGTIITIPIYAIHRDSDNYPDPEKFDPDRFSAEERAKRDPYTYMPFSIGPRNCVAMRFALLEVKVCLAYVISNFIIKRCPQTKVPLDFGDGFGVLKPKEITVSMELRNDQLLIK